MYFNLNPETAPPRRAPVPAFAFLHRLLIVAVAGASFTNLSAADPANADSSNTGSLRTRYLVLDSRIIADTQNAKLTPGTVSKHAENPLFGEDKPWEKRFDNLYGNVIFDHDEKIYKCWYSPFIVDHSSRGLTQQERDSKRYRPPRNREMGICYATSKDGITWHKPSLGLVEFEGSTANNLVLRGPHGAGITKDSHDPDPSKRYKMILQGVSTSFSADGLNWSKPKKIQGIGKIAGDTHNNLFWDPADRSYVGITRTWGDLGRQVTRLQSSDFDTWENTGVVLEATEKSLQPYAMPVFFHGGVYLGLVAIHAQRPVDRVWTELAWSPDSKQWNRIAPGQPLIPCSETVLDYDYGCVYACAYPVFLENQIRLYYGGSDYYHYGWRSGNLSLATLRPDGFAGYEQQATDKPAIIKTKDIPYAGKTPRVTADVSPGGSITVSVTDPDGRPIGSPITITKTVTDDPLPLPQGIDATAIKLVFELKNAKIYGFSFAP